MINVLLVASVVLSLAGAVFAFEAWRKASKLSGSDLEGYARAHGIVYVPVREDLVVKTAEWSKPVQIRFLPGRTDLVWDMQMMSADVASPADVLG